MRLAPVQMLISLVRQNISSRLARYSETLHPPDFDFFLVAVDRWWSRMRYKQTKGVHGDTWMVHAMKHLEVA